MMVQQEDGATSGRPAVSSWQLQHRCLMGNEVPNQLQPGEIKNTAQLELIFIFITFFHDALLQLLILNCLYTNRHPNTHASGESIYQG